MAPRKERTLVYQAFQEQRLGRGPAQLARTAPARRAMTRGQGRGTAVCSNVPTAVDSQPKRILAGAVRTDTSERDGLSPMALPAQAVLERPCAVGAAMGDDPGAAGKACVEAGLTPDVARPSPSANTQLGLFRTEDLRYAGATAPSPCPAGALLTVRGDTGAQGRPIR
jgi:hypothetical protein